MEEKVCQSCGMPLTEKSLFGTNSDGTRNEDYCCYCYKDGAFCKEETLAEMIKTCAPIMVEEGNFKTVEEAKAMLQEYLPKLKRWAKTV